MVRVKLSVPVQCGLLWTDGADGRPDGCGQGGGSAGGTRGSVAGGIYIDGENQVRQLKREVDSISL